MPTLKEFLDQKLCELLGLKPEELTPQKLHDLRENFRPKGIPDYCKNNYSCEGCGCDDCSPFLEYQTPDESERVSKEVEEFLEQLKKGEYKK